MNCKVMKNPDHICYISTYELSNKVKHVAYVYYDFECVILKDTTETGRNGHKPMLLIAVHVCRFCMYDENVFFACRRCGKRDKIYMGDNIVSEFITDLINLSKTHAQVICIANNSRSYDAHFILSYFLTSNNEFEPQIIKNGNKIICMSYDKLKFIDSLSFMKLSVRNMPKTFGLTGIQKGYYPYLFLTEENLDYLGEIPDLSFFCPDSMHTEERSDLISWHSERKNENFVFDNRHMLITYCFQDVEILRKSCTAFNKIFIDEFQFDIFYESVTLSDAVLKIYRSKFMPLQEEKKIGIIPKYGYSASHSNSNVATKWLMFLDSKLGPNKFIKYGRNGGECEINGMKVDGLLFIDGKASKVCYEFYGCFWHACSCAAGRHVETAYNSSEKSNIRKNPRKYIRNKLTAFEIRQRDAEKIKKLEDLGYTIIIFECKFYEMLKNDVELIEFMKKNSHTLINYIEPRESLRGGRVNASTLYFAAQNGLSANYADIKSLYPYVMYTKAFPVGHPKVLIGEKADDEKKNIKIIESIENNIVSRKLDWEFEGIIFCRVIPPRKLFFPVLPAKINEKLMFHLCTKCASKGQIENVAECSHSDLERSIIGTFCSPEIKMALLKGYKIAQIYEMWVY